MLSRSALAVIAVTTLGGCVSLEGQPQTEELRIVQQPTFWIVGQWTRIMVGTPPDCGRLEVTYPEEITLLDRWPWTPGDTTQRFYFRAQQPLAAGRIVFTAGEYHLALPIRVLSWGEVLREHFVRNIVPGYTWTGALDLPRLFPMEGTDERKSGLSFLTPEESARQRESFSRNQRAAAERAVAITEDLEALFYDIPESTIPRAVYVNNPVYQRVPEPAKGCPICGTKIFEGRSAFYPWVLDPEGHPFKVQCPECGRWFPSNDFGAGDMTSGEFPDDGWGYFDEKGRPYSFVGYYVLQHYRGYNRPELFSRYYLASGDRRWARAAALVLFRIAEQHLNLALNINQRERYTRDALWAGTIPPQGTPPPSHASWFAPGFYLDGVWSIGPDAQYAEAMERIWDYFDEEDPVLLDFLQEHYHPEMRSMQDVRTFIETGYFRTMAQGVLDYSVLGNGPAAHAMALRLARFLNTPRAIELTDWAFNNPRHGMRYYLPNYFFKDGSGFESPGYNNSHYGNTIMLADLLARLTALRPQQYQAAGFPDLGAEPRFRDMFDHNIDMSLISRTYANVGDDGDLPGTDPLPIHVGASLNRRYWVSAFERWPDDVNYARALWDSEADAPTKYLTDPDLRARVTEIVQREGPWVELPSQVLDGYKHVILRSGEGDDQRALWLRYGVLYGHMHHDMLTIGYEALKRTLLPEQGYNRGPDYRTEWDMNWAIHYCARAVGGAVDPAWQAARHDGIVRLFADGGWARVAIAAERFYEEAPPPRVAELVTPLRSERTIALVDLDEKHSYAISIYRLAGGTDHYLSFHGPRGTATPAGLELVAQRTGTLAGADIEYGQRWDSEWGKSHPQLLTFSFLDQVRRARPDGRWSVEWSLEGQPDVYLRLHGMGDDGGEVALARGRPPGGGTPYELQWVMRHREGPEPLRSVFIEVLEAYEGEPLITEVHPIPVTGEAGAEHNAVAFQVVAGDRVDTIIAASEATVTTADGITMDGTFGVWSEEGGEVRRVFVAGGTRIARGGREFTAETAAWTGTIVSADYPTRTVVVAPAPPQPAALVGRYMRITNAYGNDVTHLIQDAYLTADGVALALRYDPRIGEGPVAEVHDDGVSSGVQLKFGTGLYYAGKTLSNEGASAFYRISGVRESRIYIDPRAHSGTTAAVLATQFDDADGDGIVRFVIYDYGPGDTVMVPSVITYP